jgi:hypothetical protein
MGSEPVTLVPLNGGVAALDQALARGGTVVGYKVGAAASTAPAVLAARLQAAGRLDDAVIGARLGLEDQLIAPAAEILRPTSPSHPTSTPHRTSPRRTATSRPSSPPRVPSNSMNVAFYRIEAVESHFLPNPRRHPKRTFRIFRTYPP